MSVRFVRFKSGVMWMNKLFEFEPTEVVCDDLKIIFITDEKMEETGNTDVHMHSFWEMFYVHEGTLIVDGEQERFVLKENESIIIPPNTYHNTLSTQDVSKKSVFFTFEKAKPSKDEALFEKVHAAFSRCGFYRPENGGYIGTLLGSVLEYHAGEKIGKTWRMRAGITELIFALYDSISGKEFAGDTPLRENSTYWAYKYAIDRLLDINYTGDISLDFLSRKLFLSPQNITRIISSAYGKSFHELKLELKMRNAKKMLEETNLSVAKIGEKIGYSSMRGFLTAFLKYEGCTPSEYRERSKEN
ncbi:MAG: helix-turn-helix transcriptional regulator [Ruminococcaceae bacterium]|nr:helix-turn-helix transcriptional regulator [Oscillospiraceae bacterium]